MTDLVGRRLGPYELVEVVRRRRTATTYRAVVAERAVAVTVLPRAEDPAHLADLVAEARAVAELRHPHIAAIEDVGAQDGHLYLVEEYVGPRRTLADRAPGPMEPADAVGVVVPLLSALGHAHERAVVHHDVTPRHIVLPSPVWPLLADFAIGRGVGVAGSAATSFVVVGDPAYLAPEQAFGLPADPRTDLYAITVVLYELLTGRLPFDADTPEATLRAQAYEPPPAPRRLRPELPADLERVLLRGLAKQPDRRPASAAELHDELWSALRGAQVEPVVTPSVAEVAAGAADLAPEDSLAADYAAGVRAFAEENWQEAVALLGRVADADPTYEDVFDLLRAATGALEDDTGRSD